MTYIENIFICLTAPLIIAILVRPGKGRQMMSFLLSGMTACLLSSYISTFLAAVNGADLTAASLTIAPVVEESMKLVPVLFYLLVFEPRREEASGCVTMTAIGFATFENACYLIQNGAAQTLHLLIRGFGTGAMHVVCGIIVSVGLFHLWDRVWIRMAGIIGVLAVAISFHGIFNMLVSQQGAAATAGYLIPMITGILSAIFVKNLL